ncbi:MAG: response regulator [Deltaproteobacteria bacterium]|nr:response regulator [Deltaproteobacteria bacterium]
MKKERVLIVDDEIDLLNLVDFNLSRKGYITSSSLDGLDAMSKIEDFKPEMVILDLMLPNMDGWKICKYLRKRKKDIKVIMLTAKAMPEDRLKGLEIGADDYITKPFSVEELIIRVERLLEKKAGKGCPDCNAIFTLPS